MARTVLTCRKAKIWSTALSRSVTFLDMTWFSMVTAMHSSVSGSPLACLYAWKYSFSAAAYPPCHITNHRTLQSQANTTHSYSACHSR